MAEYIERGALMQFPIRRDHYDRKNGNEHFINGIESVLEYAENLPAADVAPVVHGRWIDNHCTVCGMMPMGDEMWKNHDCEPPLFERFMDYCPICGAKMDGGED